MSGLKQFETVINITPSFNLYSIFNAIIIHYSCENNVFFRDSRKCFHSKCEPHFSRSTNCRHFSIPNSTEIVKEKTYVVERISKNSRVHLAPSETLERFPTLERTMATSATKGILNFCASNQTDDRLHKNKIVTKMFVSHPQSDCCHTWWCHTRVIILLCCQCASVLVT